ncbi:EAL domain-containing protein [Lachnospiraceae bacterium WCA-693-APC-MOT-I]|uniref:EAL domain-containing protein n=2 Tax=Velocimicrobium porci TaxID=2606634 RepID=A0A6L5XZ40_9FIRM|nr:EAL domain-containing protein [Velocimicrobium porci]
MVRIKENSNVVFTIKGGTKFMIGLENKAIELSEKMLQFYTGRESFQNIVPFLAENFSWNGIRKGEYSNSLEETICYYEKHKDEQSFAYFIEDEQFHTVISNETVCVIEGFAYMEYYEYSKSFKSPLIMTFVFQITDLEELKLIRFHISIPTVHAHLLQENGMPGKVGIEKYEIEDVSHDYLTKLYSERTAIRLINNYLAFCSKRTQCGLFLITLDNMAEIYMQVEKKNSELILSEAAQKLKMMFRSSDIITRIKEECFLVFMKDIKESSIVLLKCQKICRTLQDVYSYGNKKVEVTVSVGASILTCEDSFEVLLKKAKVALEEAKKKGNGQYSVDSISTDAIPKNLLQIKYDRINVIPVCLNLITRIGQPKLAINRVLEIVGELYHLKRTYILELSNDNRFISMNYEWFNKETESKRFSFQRLDCFSLGQYFSYFDENEILQWSKDCPLPKGFQMVIPNSSLAGIQLLFYVSEKPIGVLGIEYKDEYEHSSYEDINLFRYIAQIIGIKLQSIRYEKEIARLSGADAVTGFMSYSTFYELGEEIIQNKKGQNYAICSFEIRSLSEISEWYGYSVLNKVIRYFSDLLKQELPNTLLLARDRNSVFHVLTLLESNDQFMIALDKLYAKKKVCYEDEIILLQFLGGIYFFNDLKVDSISYAIDRADAARKSVSEKHHTFALFDDAMERMLNKEKKLISRMNNALREDEFKIYMQPKYRLSDEQFVGAEALIRWISPKFGFLSPNQFIPIFEKNEFIIEIDFFVLKRVCEKLQSIYESEEEMYTISINQSRITITKTDYIKRLQETLNQFSFPKQYIELEITESVFGQDMDGIVKVVKQIKKLGCMVSIDDFGSGYSSLNMVRLIPFDVLKLDRGFLPDGELSERSHQIIESIIEMANRIHVRVICEGVETRNQVEFLEQIGCDHVQGYYFSKPMPMDILDMYLANRNKTDQILRDLTEKGFQIASKLLGDLFHQKIYMENSKICPSRAKQLLELVHLKDNNLIGIKTMFSQSEIKGSILILLKKSYASWILKGEELNPYFLFQLNEETIKRLEDLGSIVAASYAKIIKEVTGLTISSSYTEVFKEDVEDIIQYTVTEMNGLAERVRCIENRFFIHKNYREELIAQLFLFLDSNSEKLILDTIERNQLKMTVEKATKL